MAEESKVVGTDGVSVEKTDRGLFDFMGKKEEKPQEEVIAADLEKVHVSEPEKASKVEKKELHRTNSSSSSSSSDEEVEVEGGERKKKKKGIKETLKEKISREEKHEKENDTSVPVEKYEEAVSDPPAPEEKKGFIEKINMKKPEVSPPPPAPVAESVVDGEPKAEKKGILEKIKEKLPGQQKKPEEVAPPPAPVAECVVDGDPKAEKKGIMDKIKEKLPGYHPKATEGVKEKEIESN